MERYWQIEKVNLKNNIPIHAAVCVLMLLLSPFLMGVANLGAQDSAKVLEMYVALTGIVLIPPVFLPEQDHDIRELIFSKYTDSQVVYLIRLLGNIFLLAFMLSVYIGMLRYHGCEFPAGPRSTPHEAEGPPPGAAPAWSGRCVGRSPGGAGPDR